MSTGDGRRAMCDVARSITAGVNATLRAAWSLANCESNELSLKAIGALLGLATQYPITCPMTCG